MWPVAKIAQAFELATACQCLNRVLLVSRESQYCEHIHTEILVQTNN